MKSLRIVAFARGCDLADSLNNGSEAGLLHLTAISQVVKRKIRVWDPLGQVLGVFGCSCDLDESGCSSKTVNYDINRVRIISLKEFIGVDKFDEVDGCYSLVKCSRDASDCLELQYECKSDGRIGHWSTKGLKTSDRHVCSGSGNNCLFEAVCEQCQEYEPDCLRTLTAEAIRKRSVIVENAFPQFKGPGILLLGGARYDGRSAEDAKAILDESQGTSGHSHVAKAHPRGHASHPNASGYIDSVENYSRSSTRDYPKSGWLSREDQNSTMHRLLLSTQIQEGIASLNRGLVTRAVIKIKPDFEILLGLWANGEMFSGPLRAEFVTILLQHHQNKQNDADANVQVFTCYPMAPKGSEKMEELPREVHLKRPLEEDEEEDDSKKPKLY